MAVVELLRQEFGDLSSTRVLVVGAHHTNSRILELLRKQGCTSLFIANRTADAALKLASAENCRVVPFEELKAALNDVDIVVCATASLNPIITVDMIQGNRPLTIIDIAVPRDVEPAVGSIAGVRLFSIDAVESRIDQNLERRLGEIVRAQMIIEAEVTKAFTEKNMAGSAC